MRHQMKTERKNCKFLNITQLREAMMTTRDTINTLFMPPHLLDKCTPASRFVLIPVFV